MQKARSIMTKNPIVVKTTDTVSECMKIFLRNEITQAPVVDPMLVVHGVLDEFTLLKAYVRYVIAGQDPIIGKHPELFTTAKIVREGALASSVLEAMCDSQNKRLLVVNRFNHLVGIISPRDVMKYIKQEKEKVA